MCSCINTSEFFKIRIEVMNLTSDQWDIIKGKAISLPTEEDHIITTVKDFYNEIGFQGGMFMSGKTTVEEKIFIKQFYEYGNSR